MPPNQPYLAADPERLARWHAALDSHPRPRVGILWHDAEGEPGIGVLAEVVAGLATPVSLAIGAMRETLSGHPEILDGGAHIDGPADLIAAIAALDAVVVVDALAAAIGGALGKPGLVLVPPAARWVWARKDDHTLWFPSLEPTAPADRATGWDAMVPALRARLVEITGEPRSPEPPNREHPA